MDVKKTINYTERILKGSALNKYRQVLVDCKQLENVLAVDKWTLGQAKSVTIEQFWYWFKKDAINGALDLFTGPKPCAYFEEQL